VLRPLTTRHDPNLLVGLQTSDDAAVYKLSEDQAIVQTVDFFTPVVDDPYTYGAIAAANSLSDIFAMGGEPLFALNVAGFPDNLDLGILARIFEGGADKAAEAGIVIAGGHTVTDAEPKYGLIVTGLIHPQETLTKAGAKPGDLLYLTKPLGTGVVTTALKQEAADASDVEAAIESMLTLNMAAGRAARQAGVNACTDITGFGLMGHATEVAIKSGVGLRFDANSVPLLPGAERYATEGRVPGGGHRNRDYYQSLPECGVTDEAGVPDWLSALLFGPETSGGLLVSVAPERAPDLEAAFREAGVTTWKIGLVVEGRGIVLG
jgi:selenide,water dikinase